MLVFVSSYPISRYVGMNLVDLQYLVTTLGVSLNGTDVVHGLAAIGVWSFALPIGGLSSANDPFNYHSLVSFCWMMTVVLPLDGLLTNNGTTCLRWLSI